MSTMYVLSPRGRVYLPRKLNSELLRTTTRNGPASSKSRLKCSMQIANRLMYVGAQTDWAELFDRKWARRKPRPSCVPKCQKLNFAPSCRTRGSYVEVTFPKFESAELVLTPRNCV